MSQSLLNIYEFGSYRIDAAKRLLFRDGEVVPLTPKCFEILVALVENRGAVIDKESLMKRVWPDSFVEEGNLTYNISILRKALGERAGERQYIATVPGRGYQFVATVNPFSLGSAEEALNGPAIDQTSQRVEKPHQQGEANAQRPEQNGHGTSMDYAQRIDSSINATRLSTEGTPASFGRYRLVFITVALATIAVIGAVGYLRSGGSTSEPIRKLAVLPLINGSDGQDLEYLSEGISESLINSLSQLAGVKVIARTSSFKYKGLAVDPNQVARELGVEAILTGRVALLGDNLQISTELMDARDNTQIWGEQYIRKASDLLLVQSEISTTIARKLRLKLTPPEQQQLAKRETFDPQAYEMILRGRFHREKEGTENLNTAVDYFKRAITVDPACAAGYAELSIMYTALSSRGILDPKEYLPQAEAAARKALDLDENLGEAHYALANLEANTWNWSAAGIDFERALELNPGLARARYRHAVYLSIMREHDRAVEEIERARELSPLSPRFRANVGMILLLARRYDEAVEVLKNTLDMDQSYGPARTYLGQTYAAKGMYREAIAAYQDAIKLGDDLGLSTQIHLGAAYAWAGQREKAQSILERLKTTREYVSAGLLPILYVALGEREQAFASLERAYNEHDPQLQYLGVYPEFDPIRSDPRFQDLMRRVGLPQ
jgi:DNA-binding winged helix-turn-helix (wHTH) protein/TolB-like protein/Flp pilus assembly protein TadD